MKIESGKFQCRECKKKFMFTYESWMNRNYYHNKVLSSNMNSNIMSNTNKAFKITVGLKPEYLTQNYKKSITSHCSPNSSSSNFYYNSQYNKNIKKNNEKPMDELNKKKVVNYNIINNIQDNSTQINIYTGSELYKSLHFHNNSVFNSPNLTPGSGTFSKSPIGKGIGDTGHFINREAERL